MNSSPDLDSHRDGSELNQLSRFLFDTAAERWYCGLKLEVLGGIIAVVLNVLPPPEPFAVIGAIAVSLVAVVAYGLRLWAEGSYDVADTMRRQSVLTLGLGWRVPSLQLSEWRRQAGEGLQARVVEEPLPEDYYEARPDLGASRLADMLSHSAFYTRYQYHNLRRWMIGLFVVVVAISFLALIFIGVRALPDDAGTAIAKSILLALPILLTVNVLGWVLRLNRLITAIHQVEDGLDRLRETDDVDLQQVLRLLSEYNCQVVGGIPVHLKFFLHWASSIERAWNQRSSASS